MTTFSLSLMKGDFFALDDCMTEIAYYRKAEVDEVPHAELGIINQTYPITLRSKGTSIMINSVKGMFITFTIMIKEYGKSLAEASYQDIEMELTRFIDEYEHRIVERF